MLQKKYPLLIRLPVMPALLWLCLRLSPAAAQQPFPNAPAPLDSSKIIRLIHADSLQGMQARNPDSASYQKLLGNVALQQGNTLFYCDSAIRNLRTNEMDAYGHIHINQNDSVHAYSDYLHYLGNEKTATLQQNVKLTDGTMVLTTPRLEYDLNLHTGVYGNGGKLVNGNTVLTSEQGTYFADTKDAYFKTNVKLTDPQYTLTTDTLHYNTLSKVATFVAPTTIHTSESVIHTSCGFYDTQQGFAHLCNRSSLTDSSQTLTADSLNYDKATGLGTALGNVVWTDTSRKITVLAGYAVSNENTSTILATRQPLMILERPSDSLYLAADTLFSGIIERTADTLGKITEHNAADTLQKVPEKDTADTLHVADSLAVQAGAPPQAKNDTARLRYIIAYHHVRLFSDSLQGVSDSLYYSDVDSVFRFYQEPVLWVSGNQLTGDTILLRTRNQAADRLDLKNNAMIVNQAGAGFYNQIKGNNIYGYFSDNNLDWMQVNGNAETVYFAKDDEGAFVGGNKMKASAMRIYFKDGQLYKVTWLSNVDGTMTPLTQADPADLKLRNFRWEEDRRPKSREELFNNGILNNKNGKQDPVIGKRKTENGLNKAHLL